MVPFIIVYIMIFILSFKIKKDKFDVYDYITLLILILFSGLRTVGVDYHLYSKIYSKDITLESRTGIGYSYLMFFWKYILNFEYQSLIFFVSFITIISIYFFLKKNSERPGMSILTYISLGFYSTSFNMFRQSCSIALILLGSHFFKKRKKVSGIILYIFAFLLHSSSIIAIICYIMADKFKNIKLKFRFVFPMAVIATLLYDWLFKIVISMFDGYAMYANYEAKPRYRNIY